MKMAIQSLLNPMAINYLYWNQPNKDMTNILSKNGNITHGYSRRNNIDPLYQVWQAIKDRCLNKTSKAYHHYGGRGITICDRWINSFQNFIDDVGVRPTSKHSIDRIDNNKGYSPENCRWATWGEQSRNKRSNRSIIYKGEKLILKDFCKLHNLPYANTRWRIDHGWTIDETLESTKPQEIQFKGISKTILEWSLLYNINKLTLYTRLSRGWPIEKALTHKR